MQTNGSAFAMVYTNQAFTAGFSGAAVANGFAGQRFSFKPDAAFAFGTVVNLRLRAQDMEGNPVLLDSWAFTVQSGDAVPPTISKLSPYNGQSGVEPNSPIYLETADNVQVDRNTLNVHVVFPAIDGGGSKVAVTNGNFTPEFQGPGSSILSNAYGGFDIRIDYSARHSFPHQCLYCVCHGQGHERQQQCRGGFLDLHHQAPGHHAADPACGGPGR